MDLSEASNSYNDIAQIEQQASLKRKKDFLHVLIVSLIVLHLVSLGVMILPPISTLFDFVILGISLSLNFGIFYLNQRNFIQLAAKLFCYFFDSILFLVFLTNLIDNSLLGASLLGYMLGLSVLLAGMLISPKAPFWFASLNMALIFIAIFSTPHNRGEPEYLRLGVLIGFFQYLVALISWFYQRTLNQTLGNLAEARQEVMRTRILQRDVEIARDLQQQLYPSPPQYGQRVCFAARCEPAQDTGGDFYDFIDLGGGRLGIIVADVSGKSISAAMVMTMARSMLRQEAQLSRSPGAVLTQANRAALKDANINHIFTVFYGILNTRTLSLRYANAGHPYPLLKRNGQLESLEVPGFPLNIYQEATYQDHKITLQPGDQLIWISDGIVEAKNSRAELFQFERLEAVVQQTNGLSAADMVDHIWNMVAKHRGEAEQSDDITVVVANFGGEDISDNDQP